MNIEESISNLNYLISEYKRTIQLYGDFFIGLQEIQAIETLLTAYEKEKEKNKKIDEYVKQCEWHDNDVYIGEDILDILEEE